MNTFTHTSAHTHTHTQTHTGLPRLDGTPGVPAAPLLHRPKPPGSRRPLRHPRAAPPPPARFTADTQPRGQPCPETAAAATSPPPPSPTAAAAP